LEYRIVARSLLLFGPRLAAVAMVLIDKSTIDVAEVAYGLVDPDVLKV
jgi:hypothetical protein